MILQELKVGDELAKAKEELDDAKLQLDEAKALNWLGKGAMPSDTVKSLLSSKGIIKKFHESKKASK